MPESIIPECRGAMSVDAFARWASKGRIEVVLGLAGSKNSGPKEQ